MFAAKKQNCHNLFLAGGCAKALRCVFSAIQLKWYELCDLDHRAGDLFRRIVFGMTDKPAICPVCWDSQLEVVQTLFSPLRNVQKIREHLAFKSTVAPIALLRSFHRHGRVVN
jgi:hypothetical protein